MTKNGYMLIKEKGALICFDDTRQYWMLEGSMYYLDVSGDPTKCGVWCPAYDLFSHLRRLHNITGHRWEDTDGMVKVHTNLLPKY